MSLLVFTYGTYVRWCKMMKIWHSAVWLAKIVQIWDPCEFWEMVKSVYIFWYFSFAHMIVVCSGFYVAFNFLCEYIRSPSIRYSHRMYDSRWAVCWELIKKTISSDTLTQSSVIFLLCVNLTIHAVIFCSWKHHINNRRSSSLCHLFYTHTIFLSHEPWSWASYWPSSSFNVTNQ